MYTAIGKPELFQKITHFPSCPPDEVEPSIGAIIDLTGCAIPENKKLVLAGRFRFWVLVIAKLVDDSHLSKQVVLDNCIDAALEKSAKDLSAQVADLLASDKAGGMICIDMCAPANTLQE